ncbi:hypothetical protein EYZ11_006904 [Aspergillus tanneri]|uniref:Uncharacterized protein n=1 Tax=Aspergillus tanneri TaxID=1220188 RepID=A0A4S3JEM8_9EURO|nr:hypothetical protein EYZ11_006904 [Aspergillus tanneri]
MVEVSHDDPVSSLQTQRTVDVDFVEEHSPEYGCLKPEPELPSSGYTPVTLCQTPSYSALKFFPQF